MAARQQPSAEVLLVEAAVAHRAGAPVRGHGRDACLQQGALMGKRHVSEGGEIAALRPIFAQASWPPVRG